jgi:hypothetical protein
MSADGEGAREYRVEISWVIEKGGLYNPTSPKNAGRTLVVKVIPVLLNAKKGS